jgi:hypothetical protein
MKVAKFLETWLHRPPPFHQVDIKEQVVKKKNPHAAIFSSDFRK